MKDFCERKADYFDFLWNVSLAVIHDYFFKNFPEIKTYVQPGGAATTLMVAAHYAVLRQRDELFGTDGEFDDFADEADEIDDYIAMSVDGGARIDGLPSDMYQKLTKHFQESVNPDAMWLLADMGGGGKKGRVVAIHSQIGNCICRSYFRQRGVSVKEMGDAGNVLNRLFALCYTKYAETLGFNEADYDETLRPREDDDIPRERPVIDSISRPEHPFVSSLVEHITSDELKSYGHEAPNVGLATYWAIDYFNEYFGQMNARIRQLTEGDVQEFCESIDEYVRRYAPLVSKKHLENRIDYVYSYGSMKGEMVVGILKEILGDDKFADLENDILAMTTRFIDERLGEDEYDDEDLYD